MHLEIAVTLDEIVTVRERGPDHHAEVASVRGKARLIAHHEVLLLILSNEAEMNACVTIGSGVLMDEMVVIRTENVAMEENAKSEGMDHVLLMRLIISDAEKIAAPATSAEQRVRMALLTMTSGARQMTMPMVRQRRFLRRHLRLHLLPRLIRPKSPRYGLYRKEWVRKAGLADARLKNQEFKHRRQHRNVSRLQDLQVRRRDL